MRIKTAQKGGPGRPAYRVLAKSPIKGHGFLGQLGKVGGKDRFVARCRDMRIQVVTDHEKNVRLGLGKGPDKGEKK